MFLIAKIKVLIAKIHILLSITLYLCSTIILLATAHVCFGHRKHSFDINQCVCDRLLPDPRLKKLFSFSTQLSTKFILLINVKMPTIVDILTFDSMINTTSERPKARNVFICRYISDCEQLKFGAQILVQNCLQTLLADDT